MENNILKVVFGANRTSMENYARSASLWQYDYGQKLLIEGVTLPMAYEVHFSNKRHGNSVTVIGDDTGVNIPDEMLLSGQDVYAWVYLHSTENDGETEYMVTIPVNKRAEPTNDLPTQVQQDVIDQTIAALQAAVARSETNVTHYPCIIDGYWYVWDAEQNAFVNTEVSGHGEKGDDGNGIARIELNPDYTLTFYYTNGTSYTTGSIRGAQGPQGEPGPKGDKGDKGDPGKPMDIIDDTAGAGETERAWSADKLVTELGTKADKTDTVLNTTLSRGRKENTTVGQYSIAFGYDAEASGALSQAVGLYPTASGVASHAEGNSTTASGEHSHAEGSGSTASGVRSHAEGYSTVATGPNSHTEGNGASTAQGAQSAHAEGEWTQANAQAAHAEGMGTRADGYYAHSEGDRTVAAGNYGHAEGSQTAADGSASHAEGYKATANGNYSHVEGDNTYASGQSSHAEGVRTEAAGLGSHAEGYYSKSTGQYAHTEGARGDIASKMYNGVLYVVGASGARSHAEGLGGVAAGTEAHAEGNGTYAIGDDSHAEGIDTKAIGLSAHTEGSYNIASGMCSHAEGYSTIANGHNSHVSGRYNIADGNNNYAEIIGNGTGNATRSNARTLDWNGNEYLRGDLYVNCNPDGTGGTKVDPSGGGDVSNKADKTDTVLLTTLSRGRKANTTVGTASFAFGEDVTASGMNSHAEGGLNTASGSYSHAEGYNTTASDDSAHAEGILTTASNDGAHAEGYTTTASGIYAHAEGYQTAAGGYYSHAEGRRSANSSSTTYDGVTYNYGASGTGAHSEGENAVAYGANSHAEGLSTIAIATQAHAEGYGTVASGSQAHAEGSGTTASGQNAHAEGAGTSASGQNAHAEGAGAQATSDTAHAEGAGTRASGGGSHAEGGGSVASGGYSHAEGAGTVASGTQAHAEGGGTQANGEYSHAEGQGTKANAKESHAEGHYTVAAGEASHVFGKFNVADNYSDYPEWVSGMSYAVGDLVKVTTVVSGVTTVKGYKCYTANSDTTFTESKWARYDYLHYVEIVGNGEGPNEYASNARTLDWGGNERLKGNVYVECNADGSGGTKLPKDVQVNGVSVVNNGVANVPIASMDAPGVIKSSYEWGIGINSSGLAYVSGADNALIKQGTHGYRAITPERQEVSTFYGLAKAAGNSDQSSSDNAVGVYTDDAKRKITDMIEPQFRLIGDVTLSEDTLIIDIKTDGNGLPFSLKEVIINGVFETSSNTGNVGVNINDGTMFESTSPYLTLNNALYSSKQTRQAILEIRGGRFFGSATGGNSATSYVVQNLTSNRNAMGMVEVSSIDRIRIRSLNDYLIPSGSKVTVYGR